MVNVHRIDTEKTKNKKQWPHKFNGFPSCTETHSTSFNQCILVKFITFISLKRTNKMKQNL